MYVCMYMYVYTFIRIGASEAGDREWARRCAERLAPCRVWRMQSARVLVSIER